MLCRPMTAAGFALPFGIWFLWQLFRDVAAIRPCATRGEAAATACLAAPLVLGLALLFVYNRAITGDGLLSPYQLYTDTYTPRHVYGFNNVVRGEARVGPRVMENYDRWAENLDASLGPAERKGARWRRAHAGRSDSIPLAMAGVIFLVAVLWRLETRWWLVAASVVSLHAVHVPYWFVGIMGWHYVFETAPAAALALRGDVARARRGLDCERSRRYAHLVGGAARLGRADQLDPVRPVLVGVARRRRCRRGGLRPAPLRGIPTDARSARHATAGARLDRGDPADRSLDYVVNDPQLDAPVLRGRFRRGQTDLAKVRAAFPDRALYLFEVKSGRLQQVTP